MIQGIEGNEAETIYRCVFRGCVFLCVYYYYCAEYYGDNILKGGRM